MSFILIFVCASSLRSGRGNEKRKSNKEISGYFCWVPRGNAGDTPAFSFLPSGCGSCAAFFHFRCGAIVPAARGQDSSTPKGHRKGGPEEVDGNAAPQQSADKDQPERRGRAPEVSIDCRHLVHTDTPWNMSSRD